MSQLSFFSAESVPPAVADLTGMLAAPGQVVLVGDGARLSVVVDRLWRAEALAEMIAEAAEQDGLKAAAEVLNENGGLDGRRVVLDIEDDGSDPTQAVSLLQRKVTDGDKPDLVWPGSTSNDRSSRLQWTCSRWPPIPCRTRGSSHRGGRST